MGGSDEPTILHLLHSITIENAPTCASSSCSCCSLTSGLVAAVMAWCPRLCNMDRDRPWRDHGVAETPEDHPKAVKMSVRDDAVRVESLAVLSGCGPRSSTPPAPTSTAPDRYSCDGSTSAHLPAAQANPRLDPAQDSNARGRRPPDLADHRRIHPTVAGPNACRRPMPTVGTARPAQPARVRRGFRNLRPKTASPASAPKPATPGPGRPTGLSQPSPRHPPRRGQDRQTRPHRYSSATAAGLKNQPCGSLAGKRAARHIRTSNGSPYLVAAAAFSAVELDVRDVDEAIRATVR
jgi:hypothetical protein